MFCSVTVSEFSPVTYAAVTKLEFTILQLIRVILSFELSDEFICAMLQSKKVNNLQIQIKID